MSKSLLMRYVAASPTPHLDGQGGVSEETFWLYETCGNSPSQFHDQLPPTMQVKLNPKP